jgi:uncharacterized membrane protein YdjX (TVP38/TMEM64 family)
MRCDWGKHNHSGDDDRREFCPTFSLMGDGFPSDHHQQSRTHPFAALTLRGDGRHVAEMREVKPGSKRGLLIKACALGAVALVAGVLVLRGVDLKGLVVQGMAMIGDAGPWVFFSAMAVLPAVGFPLLAFALPAGPAFSGQLGLGGVLAAYGAAIAVNLALTYWLACHALRPLIERLVARTGHQIPQVAKDEHVEVTLLVRITPGPPFFLQSYLLGLGRVAFPIYMGVSWAVAMAYGVGFVVFGDAIVHGKASMAIMGVSLLVAAAIIVHLVRKHYGKGRVQSVR